MVHFVIGTEAELIKVFPLMLEIEKNDGKYNFIATGQHPIWESDIFDAFGLKKPDFILYKGPRFYSMKGMLRWFLEMVFLPRTEIRKLFIQETALKREDIVMIQGDAVSSLLGGILAKRAGLKIGHIEAGMRSGDFLNPFPEEIIRKLISKISDFHFCPGDQPLSNLKSRLNKINTFYNTTLDSLFLVQKKLLKIKIPQLPKKYYIVLIHRTENLLNKNFMKEFVKILLGWSEKLPGILILHHTSEAALRENNLYEPLADGKRIVIMQRLDYLQFIKVLYSSEFIATDSGGNQQECSYIGIPTLILRKVTESPEGVGKNVVISGLDLGLIDRFVDIYPQYRTKPLKVDVSPSRIIYDAISCYV